MTQLEKAHSKSGFHVPFFSVLKEEKKRDFNISVFQPSNSFPVTPFSFQFSNYACFVFGSPGSLETLLKFRNWKQNEEAGTKTSKVRLGDFEAEGNLFLFAHFVLFQFLNYTSFAFGSPGGLETGLQFRNWKEIRRR